MKKGIICIGVTTLLLLGIVSQTSAETISNQTIESIHGRTSIRSYSNKTIAEETLITLVKAGMAAPSGMNKQPWEFIVIQDRATLDKLQEQTGKYMLAEAQAAIVVAGHSNKEMGGSTYWVEDCSAATQNILLAAHSLGLGAVWTGVYPYPKAMNAVSQILGIPNGITPLCLIPIGYPKKQQTPKQKYKKEKLHMNKW